MWSESLSQASQVLEFWKTSKEPVTGTSHDTRTLSLHILSAAGFGKSYPFRDRSASKPKNGQKLNYRDSLALVLENCLLILVLGTKFLGLLAPFRIFGKWARIGQAMKGFQTHMESMITEEKTAIAAGKVRSATITNALVRASEEGKGKGGGLSESEIFGNIFVYNFAGHDTVSITLN